MKRYLLVYQMVVFCALTAELGGMRSYDIHPLNLVLGSESNFRFRCYRTSKFAELRMVAGRTKPHELARLLPRAWKAECLAVAIHA